jgi:hypothetical protein
LTGPVVRPREGDDAIEFRDVEGEGESGAAKLGPVTLALRVGRDGQAYRHAVVAGMHAQAAQPDQLAGRAFRRGPVAEAQRRPLGLVSRDEGVALGACQHAVLQKIHHARIGVEYRQSIRVGHGDRAEVEPFCDEAVALQDGSLPVPVTGL